MLYIGFEGMIMKARWLTVGLFLILVITCLGPVIAQNIEKQPRSTLGGKWWYVGGTGPGNYTIIQNAVDNASNGDTVFVYHGTYNQKPGSLECVWVYKSISLIGEDKNITIIRGNQVGDVIRELAGDVTITGFTLENAGTGTTSGLALDIYKSNGMGTISNISIHDNIIANNENAMCMFDCNNASCFNNIFLNNSYNLIISRSIYCSINHNLFYKGGGVNIYLEDYPNFINFTGNEFRNTYYGLVIQTSMGVLIHANNFINNTSPARFNKEIGFLGLLHNAPLYKQQWSQNYWSDWNSTNPRPIPGTLYILFGGIFGLEYRLPVPVREYDPDPVQNPYNYFP